MKDELLSEVTDDQFFDDFFEPELDYPDTNSYPSFKYLKQYKIVYKRDDKNRKLLIALLVVLIVILVLLIAEIVMWVNDNRKTQKQIENIINSNIEIPEEEPIVEEPIVEDNKTEENKPDDNKEDNNQTTNQTNNQNYNYNSFVNQSMFKVNFDNLLKVNSDTKGWIRVNNTNVNLPFVQTNNNDYYLSHSFDRSNNSAGWIFLDYRNDINNLKANNIIYGHGRLDNTMFGSLRKTFNKSWYQNVNNRNILITTPTQNMVFEIFSIYTIEPESYYITTRFSTIEKHQAFINTIKSRSIYDFNSEVTTNDKILTLSTCYDNVKRAVIHAKLIKLENK